MKTYHAVVFLLSLAFVATTPYLSQAETTVAGVARCKLGYSYVTTPDEATFNLTVCVKPLWNTTTYAFVADSSTDPQPLLDTQKGKASVELDVFTTSAAADLEAALDQYFGGAIPETIEYKKTRYFQGVRVAVDTSSDLTVRALPGRGGDDDSNTDSSTSRTKVTAVYSFDADTQNLYLLTLTSKRVGPTVRQTKYIGRTITVSVNND